MANLVLPVNVEHPHALQDVVFSCIKCKSRFSTGFGFVGGCEIDEKAMLLFTMIFNVKKGKITCQNRKEYVDVVCAGCNAVLGFQVQHITSMKSWKTQQRRKPKVDDKLTTKSLSNDTYIDFKNILITHTSTCPPDNSFRFL